MQVETLIRHFFTIEKVVYNMMIKKFLFLNKIVKKTKSQILKTVIVN